MESGPLSTPEFKEFAKTVVLFCHITTRIPGRKHDDLLTKKGGTGFPYLAYMDDEGNVLHKPGRSVEAFREGAEKVGAFLKLKKKADKTDAEKVELLLLEVDFGTVGADDARKRAKELEPKLDAATKEKLAKGLALLDRRAYEAEVKALLRKHRPRSREEAQALVGKLGPQFWEEYQAGKRITDDPQGGAQAVYEMMLQYGLNEKQAGPARAGYEGLERMFGRYPQARGQLDKLKAQVDALEGGGGGK